MKQGLESLIRLNFQTLDYDRELVIQETSWLLEWPHSFILWNLLAPMASWVEEYTESTVLGVRFGDPNQNIGHRLSVVACSVEHRNDAVFRTTGNRLVESVGLGVGGQNALEGSRLWVQHAKILIYSAVIFTLIFTQVIHFNDFDSFLIAEEIFEVKCPTFHMTGLPFLRLSESELFDGDNVVV